MNNYDEIKEQDLLRRVKLLESIVMNLLKNKSTKDLSKLFNMSEKQVREIKAICPDI
jgi:hypothetical protein